MYSKGEIWELEAFVLLSLYIVFIVTIKNIIYLNL
jgi:hypothetical protein